MRCTVPAASTATCGCTPRSGTSSMRTLAAPAAAVSARRKVRVFMRCLFIFLITFEAWVVSRSVVRVRWRLRPMRRGVRRRTQIALELFGGGEDRQRAGRMLIPARIVIAIKLGPHLEDREH